jgi:vancomycin permeability regulator SanA
VSGVPADDANYRLRSYTYWWSREILASVYAYWDVLIAHPTPILGNPEPIFP